MLQSRAIFRSDFCYGYEEGKSLEKIAFVNLENLRCDGCFFYVFFWEYFHNNLRFFCSISAVLHGNVSFRKKKSMTLDPQTDFLEQWKNEGGGILKWPCKGLVNEEGNWIHKKFHKGVDFKLTLSRFVTDVVKFRRQTAENGPIVDWVMKDGFDWFLIHSDDI